MLALTAFKWYSYVQTYSELDGFLAGRLTDSAMAAFVALWLSYALRDDPSAASCRAHMDHTGSKFELYLVLPALCSALANSKALLHSNYAR